MVLAPYGPPRPPGGGRAGRGWSGFALRAQPRRRLRCLPHPNLPQGFLGEVGEVYEPGGGAAGHAHRRLSLKSIASKAKGHFLAMEEVPLCRHPKIAFRLSWSAPSRGSGSAAGWWRWPRRGSGRTCTCPRWRPRWRPPWARCSPRGCRSGSARRWTRSSPR